MWKKSGLLSVFVSVAIILPLIAGCDSKNRESISDTEKVSVAENNDSKQLPKVIDFYATWCGPCKAISPLFDSLKREYEGEVEFVRVDVDEESGTARQYDIEAMPTFVFIDGNGVEKERIVGADAEGLKSAVERISGRPVESGKE